MKAFLLHLVKARERIKKREMEKLEKKLNETGALNRK